MTRVQTGLGEVLVFDGDNAVEVAEACEVDPAPEPDAEGKLTLLVPFPVGAEVVTLVPGDGLVHRPVMAGWLPISAEQIEQFTVPASPPEEPQAAATAPAPGADSTP